MSFAQVSIFASKSKGYFGSFFAALFVVATTGYFYTQIIAQESIFDSFIIGVVFLSASTDGFFLLLNVFRKSKKLSNLSFDPTKLSILIACYNGEQIIGETIRQVLTKVPKEQVFVVSDASTDQTGVVVKQWGVNLIENEVNKNKALSISHAIEQVKTPYVLILDDDTHIESTFIPTSLIDDGYAAVAFNVMPEPHPSLINRFQQFEYRKSMVLGKELRAAVGAIGNVSGAIGLFKTRDLVAQIRKHSGQFGGEDQQRTMMVHLESTGKGIAYTDSTVLTEPPSTFYKVFRQRYRSWNCSTHETFFLCWKIILSPKLHYMLKLERAYLIFILLTDPIRMLFFFSILFYPINLVILYCLYLFLETCCWLKTGRKDSFFIVILTPFYGMFKTFARFIAHFWWFKLKYDYLFRKKFHVYITERALILEYAGIAIALVFVWYYAFLQFSSHISELSR
jgi:cellulose synthase/poly-beta-1,6-N-acetylglucosamine synthase-like glycosyltransferase